MINSKAIKVIKGIFVRLSFWTFSFLCVWRVLVVRDALWNGWYWVFLVPATLLFFEGVYTLKFKEDMGWKWVSPAVFLYLLSVIPCFWYMEIDLLEERLENLDNFGICQINITETTFDIVDGVEIPVTLSNDKWVLALQQFLLCMLLIGRWMLPRGGISRDQLSQLLLAYMGMAADILEFSMEGLNISEVQCNTLLIYLILLVWSLSLFQFTITLTATRGRGARAENVENIARCSCTCCGTSEVWGMAMGLLLQDGPFLVMRIYLLSEYEVLNQMMIFFTCKNILVIMLQSYRFLVIVFEANKVGPEDEENAQQIAKQDELKQDELNVKQTRMQVTMHNNNNNRNDTLVEVEEEL